jgi:integrase
MYLDWRVNAKKKTGKKAGRNTAIFELKLLSQIMDEAVRMEEADANPLSSLDVHRDEAKEKPEIQEPEIQQIMAALRQEPEWMQIAFTVALHTGCRLRETRLHIENIKPRENKITFGKPKGGKKRAFSVPLPKRLRALLVKLKKRRKEWIFEFPFQPSRRWQQFFVKLRLSHLTFHCTRVTFVTRLHRAGVPREIVMRLVNHGNELIHRIYEREKVEDLMPWTGKIDEAMEMAFSPQASPKQVPQKRMDKRRRH